MENKNDKAIVHSDAVIEALPNAENLNQIKETKESDIAEKEAQIKDISDEPSSKEDTDAEAYSAPSDPENTAEEETIPSSDEVEIPYSEPEDSSNEQDEITVIYDNGDNVSDCESESNIFDSVDNVETAYEIDADIASEKSNESHGFSVADAMRKIQLFTEEMEREQNEDKISDAQSGDEKSDVEPADFIPDMEILLTEIPNAESAVEDISPFPLVDQTEDAIEEKNSSNEELDIISALSNVDDLGVKPNADDNRSDDPESDEYALEESDDDEFILEDEFSSIPDSFFDDDYADDENSSISALLYDDEEATDVSDFESRENVSFTELKEQMEKIKSEALELHVTDDTSETDDESEENGEEIQSESPDTDTAAPDEAVTETVDEAEIQESESEASDTYDSAIEEAPVEKKIYARDIERDDIAEESPEGDDVKEHIITIDRSRIREKSVPEGRLIDKVFSYVELSVFIALISIIISNFAFKFPTVSGNSMYPTFNNGDKLIISNLFYEPKRGDVVVFDDRSITAYDGSLVIKRIIGLEGDTVKIEDGVIYVKESGSDSFEAVKYVADMESPFHGMDEVLVGAGEIFVLGDNINYSLDSEDRSEYGAYVGNVRADSILGKVILRYYKIETVYSEETGENTEQGRIVFDIDFNDAE